MPDRNTLHFYNMNAKGLYKVYQNVERGVSIYFKSFFKNESSILEIGFGSGRDLVRLLDEGMEANGIEASISMLNIAAEKNPKLKIRVWLDSLPELKTVETGSYDGVLCSAVLMHISKKNMSEAIKNISRVIGGNGRLLISVPTVRDDVDIETLRDKYGRFYNNFSPNLYVQLFKIAGFKLLFQEENSDGMHRGFNWVTMGFRKL